MATSTNKTVTTESTATAQRKQADGFVNINSGMLSNIAINFGDSDKVKELWEIVHGFSPEDQKTFLIQLIEQSNITVWLKHLDEGKSNSKSEDLMTQALARMSA